MLAVINTGASFAVFIFDASLYRVFSILSALFSLSPCRLLCRTHNLVRPLTFPYLQGFACMIPPSHCPNSSSPATFDWHTSGCRINSRPIEDTLLGIWNWAGP